jgi:iron-sulfur cluster repair protein YtfE (RIC family)
MYSREIAPASTVNDVIARFPETVSVFNAFGIDSCCGGAASLEEASRRDGVNLAALLTALESVVVAPASERR